jgi:hypothetical protein
MGELAEKVDAGIVGVDAELDTRVGKFREFGEIVLIFTSAVRSVFVYFDERSDIC